MGPFGKVAAQAGAKSTHSVRIWDRVPGNQGQKLFYRMGENRSQSHLATKAKSYQVQHIEEQFSDIFITGEHCRKTGIF